MRFTVSSNIAQQVRSLSQKIRQRISDELPELLEEAGVQILSNAQLDYVAKSRGGTGSDGVKWAPLQPKTVERKNRRGRKTSNKKTKSGKVLPGPGQSEIGIDTGLQRASASPGFVGPDGKGGNLMQQDPTSITVGFNREYSEHFDAKRTLLPETLPDAWEEQLSDIAQQRLDRIMDEEMQG